MPVLSNHRHERFANLVALGASQTQAYVEAGYNDTPNVRGMAAALSASPNVAARIDELRASTTIALFEGAKVSREAVIRSYLALLASDPADLVEVKVSACRFCHGVEGRHQWRSEREYQAAHVEWLRKRGARKKNGTPFVDPEPMADGGWGYSLHLKPNPACEECDGDGIARVVVKDSAGHPLFAGVKVDKEGRIDVRMVDRLPILEKLGQIAGVFEADNTQKGGGADLAAALLERMKGTNSLPVFNAGKVLDQARDVTPDAEKPGETSP